MKYLKISMIFLVFSGIWGCRSASFRSNPPLDVLEWPDSLGEGDSVDLIPPETPAPLEPPPEPYYIIIPDNPPWAHLYGREGWSHEWVVCESVDLEKENPLDYGIGHQHRPTWKVYPPGRLLQFLRTDNENVIESIEVRQGGGWEKPDPPPETNVVEEIVE